jgi:AGZA family xanthine/uracil permease-like MFS transporter
MSAAAPTTSAGGLAGYFRFAERGTTIGTETRAGVTTFLVMAYIIFLNPSILMAGFSLPGVQPDPRFTIESLAAGTALIAGLVTIGMGLIGNYPLALAAGLGINGIVAFSLTAKGLSPAGAMGVILIEGLVILLLVAVGFREAVMNAVPLALKKAIGVGIGLFILFIGLAGGGVVASNVPATLVTFHAPTSPADFVFWIGLILTIVLWVRGVKAALVISILATTLIALAAGVQKFPDTFVLTPSFTTIGAVDPLQVFAKLAPLAAILTIFSIMLTDFFDTMGTVTGVASEAGLANEDGSVPGVGRVLLVDSAAAAIGGFGGVSSNTTYIESAAGVAEGGRTGFAAIVTGVLFLLAILLAPIAGIIPTVATAPALVLVGYLMFTQVKDIDVTNVEDGIPALLTMILMPLTYEITVGIGAGFISWVLIKVVRGKASEVHPLMWLVAGLFVLYFMSNWLLAFGAPPAA